MTDKSQGNSNPYRAPSPPSPHSGASVLESSIRLSGELSLDHMVQVQLLVQRDGRFRWLYLAGTAVIIAGLLAFLTFHEEQQTPGGWLRFAAISGVVLILGVGSYWTAPLLSRLQTREHLARQFKNSVPVSMVLSDRSLQVTSADGEVEFAWTAFDRIRQSASLLLLFRRDMQQHCQVFPRDFCKNDLDWDRLREFLAARFPEA